MSRMDRFLAFVLAVLVLLCCSILVYGLMERAEAMAAPAPVVTPVPTPEPTPTPTPMPEVVGPLVNPWNTLPEDYTVALLYLPNRHQVDAVCYNDLTQMLADCKAAGLKPEVCSAYRTVEFQKKLFDNKVARVKREGYAPEEVEAVAAMSVARPGTSEHHTGLAVDIIQADYPVLDETQETKPTQQWLLENSWRYGFVLRYPNGKTELTGIIYEPWHYRYVGKEAARIMYEQGLCLEEYLALQ